MHYPSIYDASMLLLGVLAVYLLYQRVLKMWYLKWYYGKQGVVFISTLPIPFIGDVMEFVKRVYETPDRAQLKNLMFDYFP